MSQPKPAKPRTRQRRPRPTGGVLTPATRRALNSLFTAKNRAEAAKLLITECGNNLPFLETASAAALDRFRLAAIKLSRGTLAGLRGAIRLAKEDWRDLLMAAGFGYDVKAHRKWTPKPRR